MSKFSQHVFTHVAQEPKTGSGNTLHIVDPLAQGPDFVLRGYASLTPVAGEGTVLTDLNIISYDVLWEPDRWVPEAVPTKSETS